MRRLIAGLICLMLLTALIPVRTYAQTQPVGEVLRLAGELTRQMYAGMACGAYERSSTTPWTKIAGLDSRIDDLLLLKNDVALAVSEGRIYRRAPGEAWQHVADSNGVATLAANPDGTHAYYLTGVSVALVYRSDDGGRTWQQLTPPAGSTSESYAADIAVAADPTSGQDVLLVSLGLPGRQGSGSRLIRSTDGGASWADVPGYSGSIAQASAGQIFLNRGATTYYVTNVGRPGGVAHLYRGALTGANVEEVALPAELQRAGVTRLLVFQDTLIVSGQGGMFMSGQRGAENSFAHYDQGLGQARVNDLLFTSHQPIGPVLFVATTAGVFGRSETDPGWMPFSEGLPGCGAVTPYTSIPPFQDSPTRRYFIQTGHSLSHGFKSFWERNGGLPVFGYPLSEEFAERNVDLSQDFTTQYLERERFEYHPENRAPYDIQLGRLGDELLKAQGRDWREEDGINNPFPGTSCQMFNVGNDQRSVCGPFLQYWRGHGLEFDGRSGTSFNESLALFGLPLTAPKMEKNPDGETVLTQWFERARFEYHPDKPEPYKVLLGRLGSEILKTRGIQVP